MELFSLAQTPEDHRGLDRAEEQQRARAGREAVIGKRKGGRINEKRQRGEPVTGAHRTLAAQFHDEPKGNGAGKDADEGETGRVDTGVLQGRPAEQRVAREGDHRCQCEDENPRRFHRYLSRADTMRAWPNDTSSNPGARLSFDAPKAKVELHDFSGVSSFGMRS